MLHEHRIVLHRELQLPPEGFADVAATPLYEPNVMPCASGRLVPQLTVVVWRRM
ncbi:MAG: hypothetical protein ACI89X_002030 [Planctomycetota bacterium]|jgi:hypothetical protein